MSAEEIRQWVEASRASQGLPETVTDPRTLSDALKALRPVSAPATATQSTPPGASEAA